MAPWKKDSPSSSTEKNSSIAPSSSTKKIVLISKEGQNFEVDEAVALISQTLKNLIEDDCIDDGGIPLPNVDSATMAKVLEYCIPHAAAGDEDLSKFNSNYVKDLKDDKILLFDVILAANYMNIAKLQDLTCQAVADMITGKTPEEIRETFYIENDFTADEDAAVRKENKWAFE